MIRGRALHRADAPRVRPSEPDAEWLTADDTRFIRRVCIGVLCVWALIVTSAIAI